MLDLLKWVRVFPALLLAAPYIAAVLLLLWGVAKSWSMWLQWTYPKKRIFSPMNYAERKALAAKRLANPELYLNKQSAPQAAHQPKPQLQKKY